MGRKLNFFNAMFTSYEVNFLEGCPSHLQQIFKENNNQTKKMFGFHFKISFSLPI